MKHSAYEIVVIGGGASGMMAAIAARSRRPEGSVLLLERNEEPGRKLLATGNGRCNFTNLSAAPEDYGEGAAFTAPVMEQWGPEKVIGLMEEMGVLHRVEGGGRVYPYSGRGASVTEALRRQMARLGVTVRCGADVKDVDWGTATVRQRRFRILLADGTQIFCEKLIIAVGGKAGGQYGCSGDGYRFARTLGHDVVKARPALVAVNCKGWNKQWKGVRSQAKVSLWRLSPEGDVAFRTVEGDGYRHRIVGDGMDRTAGTDDTHRTMGKDGVYRKIAEEAGEVQFTDFGLSGICVFDLSRHIVYTGNLKEGRRETYVLAVDFLPDRSEEQVKQMLLDRRKALRGGTADELLLSVIHERLVDGLLSQAGIGASGGTTRRSDNSACAAAKAGGGTCATMKAKTGAGASAMAQKVGVAAQNDKAVRSGSGKVIQPDAVGGAIAWPDVASVTDEQLARLAELLKGWRFEVEGTRGFNDAQVTAGGVCLEQVDPATMESKIQPGLYLCGEVLDVDGRCGGYNLQWAFASGYAAGYCAAGSCAAEDCVVEDRALGG